MIQSHADKGTQFLAGRVVKLLIDSRELTGKHAMTKRYQQLIVSRVFSITVDHPFISNLPKGKNHHYQK